MQPFAPGMRVVIRNEEWLIRRVDPSTDDGYLLRCDGLSELVNGKEALFLSALEGPIEIQAPEATKLVQDNSDKYAAALLFLESQRRRGTPNDDYIRLVLALTLVILTSPPSFAARAPAAAQQAVDPVAQPLDASQLNINLTFADAKTSKVRSSFAPGDKVRYELKFTVPSEANGKKATVSLKGKLKVGGIRLPFNALENLSRPITDPEGDAIKLPYTGTMTGTFFIPKRMPSSELLVTVTLKIDGVGKHSVTKPLKVS